MNTCIDTPKDDAYLRSQWHTLYPADELAQLGELVAAANANHVDFVFALAPGNDICYGSEAGSQTTVTQVQPVVQRRGQLLLHRSGRHQSGAQLRLRQHPVPLARTVDAAGRRPVLLPQPASAGLRRGQRPARPHDGARHYAGNTAAPFKAARGECLRPSIRVQWTDMGIFSDTITVDQVTMAATTYNTEHLLIWDNFPVSATVSSSPPSPGATPASTSTSTGSLPSR